MSQPVPGWYPDPAGSQRLRWWNGGQWIDQYQPMPGVTVQGAPAQHGTPTPNNQQGVPGPRFQQGVPGPQGAPQQGVPGPRFQQGVPGPQGLPQQDAPQQRQQGMPGPGHACEEDAAHALREAGTNGVLRSL